MKTKEELTKALDRCIPEEELNSWFNSLPYNVKLEIKDNTILVIDTCKSKVIE